MDLHGVQKQRHVQRFYRPNGKPSFDADYSDLTLQAFSIRGVGLPIRRVAALFIRAVTLAILIKG